MTRRVRIGTRTLMLLAAALVAMAAAPARAVSADDAVGFGNLDPSSGAPGREISYTVVGSPIADTECRGSSAFSTEFLAADGVRLGTGADTIGVPETATVGPAFVRLICYVSDTTGRRVIRGVCAGFEVLAPGTPVVVTKPPPAAPTINVPCPAAPRTVVSESVIHSQTALGEAFNLIITPLGG